VGTMSELAGWLEEDDEAVVCVPSAFITFPNDGRVAVERALDMTLSDEQLRVFDPEPIYANTADATCHAGLVMATSGRVPRYDLVLVEDDVGAFLPNPPAPAVRESVLLAHPQLATLLNTLAARLDTGALQAMNRSVVLEGRDPDAVAAAWLREQGLTS
jgi:osmoprotectant transport system substrate-binding protein